jgi:3-oxoacyl-[acyl-carrier protein] reductase
MRLDGQKAFITGAGQGIGEAIAMKFAEYGCDIAINGVILQNAERVQQRIQAMGRRSITLLGDVSDFQVAERMMKQAIDAFGALDILVNNAGISPKKEGRKTKIFEIEEQEWDRVLAINLKGVFNCSRTALPFMMAQKSGKIVNMSSVTGQRANLGPAAHYVASKAAVIALTKAMAHDLAPFGIRVNAVAPGLIDSPLRRRLTSPESKEAMKKEIPCGRFGTSEEVADGVLFLGSDFAKYITGETLLIDGGWIMP